MIPELEPHCGSWIVVRKYNGVAVAEIFTRDIVEKVNLEKYEVKTALVYLSEL